MLLQEIKQEQALTQYQMQSLAMLAVNGAELNDILKKEELDNPVLDVDYAGRSPHTASVGEDSVDREIERVAVQEDNLLVFLESQLPPKGLTALEQRVFRGLIAFLETDTGYLSESVEDIARILAVPLDVVERCLMLLHGMEPAGVGAANIVESLVLQAHQRGWSDFKLYALLYCHLEDLAAKHYHTIMQKLKISRGQLEEYIRQIPMLEPHPTARFGKRENGFIVPDLIFAPDENDVWQVSVQDRWSGGVPFSSLYAARVDRSDAELYNYLKERRSHADFILKCVERRRETLLVLGKCVLEAQKGFLMQGKPLCRLTQEELSERTGLNTSTVSRAFKNKYVQTPGKVYPFSFFLSKASSKLTAVSRNETMKLICDLVKQEKLETPLSDEQLTRELEKKGIRISRRTVTKYRALLGIPNAMEGMG